LNANEFNTPRVDGIDSPPYKPMHSYFTNNSVVELSPNFQVNTEIAYSESRSNTADSVDGFIIGDHIVPGAIDLDALKSMIAEARKG